MLGYLPSVLSVPARGEGCVVPLPPVAVGLAGLRALVRIAAADGPGALGLAMAAGAGTLPGSPVGGGPGRDDDDPERSRIAGLVALAQQGDAEAFGMVYDAYVDQIYRYLYYRVGSHALAEDLTSETFLRALRRIDTFTYTGKDIGAWFTTIARNLVTDHVKSSRFKLEVTTADMLDADRADDGIEQEVLDRLQNATLMDAVKRLKPEQQECIVLRFLQGLSVAETAGVMARTEGAVKQLQLRAVRALARLLPEAAR